LHVKIKKCKKQILFLVFSSKNKIGKDEKASTYLRIKLDGKRFELSKGKSVIEKMWNKSTNRIKAISETIKIINNYKISLT
jgi:hypothetical protein